MHHNVGGMASKGFRVISCQVTRKVEAGYNPSHTSETLFGYTACYELGVVYNQFLSVLKKYHLGILKFNDSEIFFAMLSLLSPVIIAIPCLISPFITGIA